MKFIKLLVFLAVLGFAAVLASPFYVTKLSSAPKVQQVIQELHEAALDQVKQADKIPTGLGMIQQATWSPDGQHVIASGMRVTVAGRMVYSLYDIGLTDHKVKRVGSYSGPHEIKTLVYSPAGDFVAVEFNDGFNTYVQVLNIQTNTFVPVQAPPGKVFKLMSIADSPLAFLPDGKKLLYVGDDGKRQYLCIYDLAAGVSSLLPIDSNVLEATWSPSGDKILLVEKVKKEGSNSVIALVQPDGTNVSVLVPQGENYDPRFSPFGKSIAFFQRSDNGHSSTLGLMQVDGSGLDKAPGLPRNAGGLSWSSEGNLLFFQATDERRRREVYSCLIESHRVTPLTTKGESFSPVAQPQAGHIAFIGSRGVPGVSSVYMSNADGGEEERLVGWFLP